MTSAELADELGVSPVTLSEWRRDGRGPKFERYGYRTVRYDRAAVRAWRRSRTRQRD